MSQKNYCKVSRELGAIQASKFRYMQKKKQQKGGVLKAGEFMWGWCVVITFKAELLAERSKILSLSFSFSLEVLWLVWGGRGEKGKLFERKRRITNIWRRLQQ